jgi:UV DNA damage endonuclease
MRIRLGFVAIALNLEKVTSSSTVTYTTYTKQSTDQKKLDKLKLVASSNLSDLHKILEYAVENEIHFYRITSALIPLATHPDVTNWDYRKILKKDFEWVGNYINKNDLRVDTHPDQFNVINSLNIDVVKNTERNLWHHVNLFNDINYPLGKMVIHIGSSQGGKDAAIDRLITNFNSYPKEITEKLIFENDDKTFTTKEVLSICKELKAPMVLDVHHHLCNDGGEKLEPLLKEIFHTWKNEVLPPKLHFSSPREGEKDKKHADFINAEAFVSFVEKCIPLGKDLDIMLEAKQKDLALYKLVEDIKVLKPQWKWLDQSTFELPLH